MIRTNHSNVCKLKFSLSNMFLECVEVTKGNGTKCSDDFAALAPQACSCVTKNDCSCWHENDSKRNQNRIASCRLSRTIEPTGKLALNKK